MTETTKQEIIQKTSSHLRVLVKWSLEQDYKPKIETV